MTTTPTLAMIEDHEGDGRCGHCGRHGLRWIARLSDGTGVGLACAKGIIGFTPAARDYAWIADYTPIAQHTEHGRVWVLWQHKRGAKTAETAGGTLMGIGGARARWASEGWI